MRTNCLFFALKLWFLRGGYLILRRSHAGPFPHAMWAASIPPELPVEQYVPKNPKLRVCPPPFFDGHVVYVAEPHKCAPLNAKFDWRLTLFLFVVCNAISLASYATCAFIFGILKLLFS